MSDQEEGPRDSADPDETALEDIEASEDAETEFHPFDEVDEDFKPGPLQVVRDAEGTFTQIDETTESDIPALSLESLICLGDFSAFVIRNPWGEIICTLTPEEVNRAPNRDWRVSIDLVVAKSAFLIAKRREYMKSVVKKFKGDAHGTDQSLNDIQVLMSMVVEPGEAVAFDPEWMLVEPIRPPCKHFVRQRGSFHLNPKHRKYYRLCSARRTTEGTFMTVSDTGMYACDMREPFDVESAKLLDDFDALKIEQGKNRKHLRMFSNDPHGIFGAPQALAVPPSDEPKKE